MTNDKRIDYKYRKFREDVLKRDTYMCQLCGADEETTILHVHHIIKYSEDVELRTNVDNGITLCKVCHQQIFNKEKQYEQVFRELLKTPIWRKRIIENKENEDLKLEEYCKLNEDNEYYRLPNTAFEYIEDVYAFKVYNYLCSNFDYKRNYVTLSYSDIAENCNMAKSTVQKAMKYLEDRKFVLKIKGEKYEKNRYYINYVFEEEIELKEYDENKNN